VLAGRNEAALRQLGDELGVPVLIAHGTREEDVAALFAAAKAGIDGLVFSAAATCAAKNIRVNAIAPGPTDTPLAARFTGNEAALKASIAMHPLGRIGTPLDIATAAAWLVDPAASWITGQIIRIDGGLSSVRPR
jgi:NAD(P)-dependent dehydrogenase (short-subunit alcohol dehydrogenase family)